MKEYIQFKRNREVGEILTDTFKYIRQEYKTLFKALVRNTAIPFLLLIGSLIFFSTTISNFSTLFLNAQNYPLDQSGAAGIGILLFMIAAIAYYAFMFATVLHHIKSYIANNGIVNQKEITTGVKKDGLQIMGLNILYGILVFIGIMLCFFPGVYVYITLSLAPTLLVFHNLSIGNSISESFKFIKNNWWSTFATLIVIWIVLYAINLIFSIPSIIYSLITTFSSAQEISQGDMSSMFDWVYITLSTLSSALTYLIYPIFAVALAFIYFNINEKTNQTGTLEEIDTIGSDL